MFELARDESGQVERTFVSKAIHETERKLVVLKERQENLKAIFKKAFVADINLLALKPLLTIKDLQDVQKHADTIFSIALSFGEGDEEIIIENLDELEVTDTIIRIPNLGENAYGLKFNLVTELVEIKPAIVIDCFTEIPQTQFVVSIVIISASRGYSLYINFMLYLMAQDGFTERD